MTMADHVLDVLISENEIKLRTAELAQQILASYQGQDLILVGILKGSLYFLADLSRHFPPSIEIDFIQVSSYRGGKSSTGVVQIRKDLDINIEGRDVLIVEDVVDTGTTLLHLLELLQTRRPNSIKVATLLSKRQAKNVDINVDFVGFEIEDEFVVGYGLDFGERYRSLPFISILRNLPSASE